MPEKNAAENKQEQPVFIDRNNFHSEFWKNGQRFLRSKFEQNYLISVPS